MVFKFSIIMEPESAMENKGITWLNVGMSIASHSWLRDMRIS